MIVHQANRPIYIHRMRQETSKKAKASKSQLCIRVRIFCIQIFIVGACMREDIEKRHFIK